MLTAKVGGKGNSVKQIVPIAALAALCVCASAETPAENLIVPPFPAATPWKNITDKSDTHMLMREWIPADQSENDIKDILTEQAFYEAKDQTPGSFIKGMFQRIAGVCAGTKVNGPVEHVENGYPIAYAQIYCAKQKGTDKDVDIFLKAIAGKKAFYVVQYEIRKPADPKGEPGVTHFANLEEAKAMLERQKAANDFLTAQVKLCPLADGNGPCPAPEAAAAPASPSTAAPKPASDDDPGPDDVSKSFGWTPGKTTADDIESKFGDPTMKRPGPDGHFTYLYQFKGGDLMVVCLFNKSKVLIRTLAYQRN
jgi:hypothetical protein